MRAIKCDKCSEFADILDGKSWKRFTIHASMDEHANVVEMHLCTDCSSLLFNFLTEDGPLIVENVEQSSELEDESESESEVEPEPESSDSPSKEPQSSSVEESDSNESE